VRVAGSRQPSIACTAVATKGRPFAVRWPRAASSAEIFRKDMRWSRNPGPGTTSCSFTPNPWVSLPSSGRVTGRRETTGEADRRLPAW
jgi:hypothetical protein